MSKVNFLGVECVAKRSMYLENDNLALVLIEEETGDIFAYVTVNNGQKFPENMGLLKNYSENTGMLEAIEEAGLVKAIHGEVPLGYTTALVVEFNLDNVGYL